MKNFSYSVIIITMNRFQELELCLNSVLCQSYENYKIYIVDNCSHLENYNSFYNKFSNNKKIQFFRLKQNLGVSGGRNYGIKKANEDIIFTLDDDAVIKDTSFLKKINNYFNKNNQISCLAVKSINYYTGKVEMNAVPVHFNKKKKSEENFESASFIGVCNFIKKSVFKKIGLYGDFFPYGHEELDLSLRMAKHNMLIHFFSESCVYHMKINKARLFKKNREFLINQFEKRMRVALYNLPLFFVITTFLIRGFQYSFLRSRFDLLIIPNALKILYQKRKNIFQNRNPLNLWQCYRLITLQGPIIF